MIKDKYILLLNSECVQAICMARSLRKLGCHVIGFCNGKISSGYATRWLSERYVTPDILQNKDKFKQYLLDFLSHNKIDLIIPLADDSAEFLSANKDVIENKYMVKCAITSYEIFNIANNQQSLMELCEKIGISHPKTRRITVDDIDDTARYVGFPSMIKPNISQGAKGIMRVDSLQELNDKFPLVHEQFGECTLQQYVDQPDYYYNVMLYRDKHGNMDYSTIIKIRRYFPLKGGSSCYCETIEHPVLLEQCKETLDALNWVGFADFDVLEDKKSGELKIIEINPRVPSSLQAAFAAGIDFGQVIVADQLGGIPMPSFTYSVCKQVRWMGLDVMWFIFSPQRFSFKPSWFNFFGKDVSYHDGSWNDPLPMFAGMLSGFIKYLNPSFRKSKLKS